MDQTDLIIKDLHAEAARLLRENNNEDLIISCLQQKGVDKHYAEMILENVKSDTFDRKEFYKHLFAGIFLLLAGIAMSIMGYELAVNGGIYIVFTGVMLYGIFNITRAFIIFRK